jgi:uncharacterized membrane protein YeiH
MDWMVVSALTVRVLDLCGVAANVLLAGVLAREERFDPVGFVFLGLVSGLGGGAIRDVMLQTGPPVALTDAAYLATALIAAAVAFFVKMSWKWWRRSLRGLDACALGTWGAVGALKTLNAGLGPLPALLLGTITAVGGGILRDLMVGRVPVVFRRSTLYATCATFAAGVVVAGWYLVPSVWQGVVTLAAAFLGSMLCLLSYWRGWKLPESPAWPLLRG